MGKIHGFSIYGIGKEKIDGVKKIKILKSLLPAVLISASVERFGVSCMLDFIFYILRTSINESLN